MFTQLARNAGRNAQGPVAARAHGQVLRERLSALASTPACPGPSKMRQRSASMRRQSVHFVLIQLRLSPLA